MSRVEDMKIRLTDAFSKEKNNNIEKLLSMSADELDEIESVTEDLDTETNIDSATGENLRRISRLFDLYKESGESDDKFRSRIISVGSTTMSNGTSEEVRQALSRILGTDRNLIDMNEAGDASVEFSVLLSDLDKIDLTDSELSEIIDNILGAGIRADVLINGTFTYRSVDDFNDSINNSDYGYNNGTYSTAIER